MARLKENDVEMNLKKVIWVVEEVLSRPGTPILLYDVPLLLRIPFLGPSCPRSHHSQYCPFPSIASGYRLRSEHVQFGHLHLVRVSFFFNTRKIT